MGRRRRDREKSERETFAVDAKLGDILLCGPVQFRNAHVVFTQCPDSEL